jgi:hypothetical protein
MSRAIPLKKLFYALSGHFLMADPPPVSWKMSVKVSGRPPPFGAITKTG